MFASTGHWVTNVQPPLRRSFFPCGWHDVDYISQCTRGLEERLGARGCSFLWSLWGLEAERKGWC